MFTDLFQNKKNIIGMIHFPPLIWFEEYPGQDVILKQALSNAHALIDGWIDAIMIENNYDIPHTRIIDTEIVSQMTFLAWELRKIISVPMWICCLWNDWKAALSIAKIVGLDFVRIPVFVDKIKTNYWYIIQEEPQEILAYREKIWANNVQIITDIHVKHSEILNQDTIISSCISAINSWSDGLIITWKWTWDIPNQEELNDIRKSVWNFPIIIWSGVTDENISSVINIVDAMIIGTFLKTDNYSGHWINLKSSKENIDIIKVKKLKKIVTNIT